MSRLLLLFILLPGVAAAGDAGKGREIALARRDGSCLLCHAIPGATRPAGNLGPSLAGVGARLGAEDIRRRIEDPTRVNPAIAMPAYGRSRGLHAVAPQHRGKPLLSAAEIDDLVAFLVTLR